MSRRKRPVKVDTEARRKRVRSFRSRERRQSRKTQSQNVSDLTWLWRDAIRASAMKVLNATHGSWFPYWLSIDEDVKREPTQFYPAKSFVRKGRLYYGFMFREHRDQQIILWPDARKELTPDD